MNLLEMDLQLVTCHGCEQAQNKEQGFVRHFLRKTESKAAVKVVGKAINGGGGYGTEVFCMNRFTGQTYWTSNEEDE